MLENQVSWFPVLGYSTQATRISVVLSEVRSLAEVSSFIQRKAGMQSNAFLASFSYKADFIGLFVGNICWGIETTIRNCSLSVSMLLVYSIQWGHEDDILFLSNTQDSSRFHTYRGICSHKLYIETVKSGSQEQKFIWVPSVTRVILQQTNV